MSLLIDCKQVSKHFGAKTALNQVSFSCEQGEPIALIGPNGAGKTTLFSILCGFIPATSGEVMILGHRAGDPSLFSKLSALPQDAQMDPDITIERQLAFYAELKGLSAKAAKKEADRVLSIMGLMEAKTSLPKMLSHGMKKRAAIAQALIGKPQLILLDEPTAGLDPANAKVIRELISTLAHEATFMISSHNLQELERLCHQVIYLEKGTHKQLTTTTKSSNLLLNQLTIRLTDYNEADFMSFLTSLSMIEKITRPHRNEFKIHYSAETPDNLDLILLNKIKGANWQYQQLVLGETLEDRLFD